MFQVLIELKMRRFLIGVAIGQSLMKRAETLIGNQNSVFDKGDSMALADYIYNKPIIETERLILRPMTSSDVPALNEWMPDKSIYTYWGKGPSKSEQNQSSCLRRNQNQRRAFIWELQKKGTTR